jgi:hypothetical protein
VKIIFLLFSLLFVNESHAQEWAYISQGDHIGEKSYGFDVGIDFFNTKNLYDSEGIKTELPEGQSFQKIDTQIVGLYGYSKQFELRGGVRYRHSEAQNDDFNISKTGFDSVLLGAKYLFMSEGDWKFAFDFQYRRSTFTNTFTDQATAAQDELVLGDSGTEVTIGGYLFHAPGNSNWHFDSYLAYNMPSELLADELLYRLQLTYNTKSWGLGFGAKGISNVGEDQFDGTLANRPALTGATFTNLYNGIEREYLAPYAVYTYKKRHWRVNLELAQTLNGVSTDGGMQILGLFKWSSPKKTQSLAKIERFKQYDVEAIVTKVSPRGKFVKIDQGVSGDVEKGMPFDIYKTDYLGGNLLIASGFAMKVSSKDAIIRISKVYRPNLLKEGFVARGTAR